MTVRTLNPANNFMEQTLDHRGFAILQEARLIEVFCIECHKVEEAAASLMRRL